MRPRAAAHPSIASDDETTDSRDAPAPAAEEGTRITSAPSAPEPRSARPAPGKSGVRPRPASARAPGARPASARASAARPATAPRPRPPAPAPQPIAPVPDPLSISGRRMTGGIKIDAPEEVLADVWRFAKGLGTADKLAFFGAATTVLLGFFPWKLTAAEGDVVGLMSLGFIAMLAALITLFAVAVRTRQLMPNLNPIIPWLAQLASAGFCILWCAVYMKLSTNGTQVHSMIGNQMIPTSRPEIFVYLALLSSLVSLVGTLLGLKEKPA